MYSPEILNVTFGDKTIVYYIHKPYKENEGFIIELAYLSLRFNNNKKPGNIDIVILKYSSMRKDDSVLNLFIKHLPSESELERVLKEDGMTKIIKK